MTFPTTPSTAFTADVSTIPATVVNAWRSYFPKALDAVGGGVYTNLAEIEFPAGSSGWKFGALVTFDTTSTVLLQAGGAVTINSDPLLTGTLKVGQGGAGGAVRFYATSTLTVDDTVAMSLAGDATWTGASTSTYQAGSTLAINTASATMGNDALLTVNGSSGHGASISFGQYGSAILSGSGGTFTGQSGSIFTLASGSFVTVTVGGGGHAGSLTVGNVGTLTVSAGAAVTMSVGGGGTTGSITFNADGTLTTTASAQFANGGTTTRTGKEVLSGNGAYTAKRIAVGGDPPTNTDPRHYDILEVAFLSADADLNLTALGASDYVEFWIRFSAISKDLTVKDGGAAIFTFVHSAGKQQTVQFYWNGSNYKVGCVGAQTTI